MQCTQTSATTSSSSNIQHQYVAGGGGGGVGDPGMTAAIQQNALQHPGMHPGGMIEATGTLSRAPQMGTKGRRMQYGVETGFPETGTLRGQIMPIGAQTSPMSSTGSTQLIYNGGSNARHLQEWAYQHPELAGGAGGGGGINKNAFDERLLYYDTNAAVRNMKPSKSHDLDDDIDDIEQQHQQQRAVREGFHFTEGRPKKHRQKNNSTSLSGSTRNIYPQHRKRSHQEDPEQGLDNDENSYLQNYRRYMQAEADAEFLNQYQRQLQQQTYGMGGGTGGYPAGMLNGRQALTPQQVSAQRYYHQHGHNGHGHNYHEEPVYEEIVGSSHMSSTYGDNGMISDDEEEDMDQGVTDEEESTSRSNKDDMSSRQSSR